MLVKMESTSSIGGGIDLSKAEYIEFTWLANQPLNLTTNGKAKALIGTMQNTYCFFVADGLNDNYAMENGTKNPNRTYTFNENSVTSTSSISSGNTNMKLYILY